MALRKRTNAYWNKRALERLDLSEKTSEAYRRRIASVYNKAQRVALADLKKIYANYWTKEGGFDKQKLNLITASGDMKKFVTSLKKAGLYDQIPKKYLGRISRLEYLNAQMWYQAHTAGQAQDKLLTASNKKIYNDSYYHSAFDVSKGLGMTPSFATLDKRTVDKILETKFSGKNYSERIWTNSDILATQLHDKLAIAVANGQSIDKTARDVRERFNVSRYNAERLIRTETNYFHNSAEIDSYKSMGFEKFQFLATLDNRTSEICAEMDGKIYDVNKGVVGYNVPPLHVNCVLPDTEISATGIYGATRSEYSGDIFKLTTSNGRTLSVTANHIMLTTRGFVRAKFIRKGDYIIGYSDRRKITKSDPTDNNSPIMAEQLFATLSKTSRMITTSMPASSEDLKGDVVSDSNIDVVLIDSFFKNKGDISSPEFIGDCERVAASVGGSLFSTNSSLAQLLMTIAFASDCIMSGNSIASILGRTSIPHHELIRLLNTTLYNSRLIKSSIDNGSSNTEFFGKLVATFAKHVSRDNCFRVNLNSPTAHGDIGRMKTSKNSIPTTTEPFSDSCDGFARLIQPRNVIGVEKVFYSGHVYDFSSVSTLYVANGLVSSNCRSTIVPYFKDFEPDEDEMRIYRDPETGKNGYIGAKTTYYDWVDSLNNNQFVALHEGKVALLEDESKKPTEYQDGEKIADKLQENSDEIFSKLSEDEKRLIDDYTDASSAGWNHRLALGENGEMFDGLLGEGIEAQPLYPEEVKFEKRFADIISKSKLGYNTKVYSGVSHVDSFEGLETEVGKTYISKKYVSASLNKKTANEFMGYGLEDNEKGFGVRLTINVPKDAKALYLGNNSWAKEDQELIINKMTQYKVISRKKVKENYGGIMSDIIDIEVEIIP